MDKIIGFLSMMVVWFLVSLVVVASCTRKEYVRPMETNDIIVLKQELSECFDDDGEGSMVEVNAEHGIYPFLLYVHSNLLKAEKIAPHDPEVLAFRQQFDELMDKYYIEDLN